MEKFFWILGSDSGVGEWRKVALWWHTLHFALCTFASGAEMAHFCAKLAQELCGSVEAHSRAAASNGDEISRDCSDAVLHSCSGNAVELLLCLNTTVLLQLEAVQICKCHIYRELLLVTATLNKKLLHDLSPTSLVDDYHFQGIVPLFKLLL